MSIFENLFEKSEGEKYAYMRDMNTENPKTLDFITELSTNDIRLIKILDFEEDFILEEFGVKLGLKKLTSYHKKLMVSHKRKGRTESTDVMKADTLEKKKGFMGNFMGGLR